MKITGSGISPNRRYIRIEDTDIIPLIVNPNLLKGEKIIDSFYDPPDIVYILESQSSNKKTGDKEWFPLVCGGKKNESGNAL